MPRFPLAPLAAALAALTPSVMAAPTPALPIQIEADNADGVGQRNANASGNVVVTQGNQRLQADWMQLFADTDEIQAGDKTILDSGPDHLEGGKLKLHQADRTGELEQPVYTTRTRRGRGDALKLLFDGPDRYKLMQARYTTCGPGNDDWFLKAGQLDLDYTRNIGTARDGQIEFKGVPILYAPWLDFSLDGSRKSGLLTPELKVGGSNGIQLTVPYYWNIAPNRDATFSPRLITNRGIMLSNEFRYLEPTFAGTIEGDYINNDRRYGDKRWAFNLQHKQALAPGLTGLLNLQSASDDRYFADFGDRIAVASKTYLPREAVLSYNQPWWNLSGRVVKFQTLQQDAKNPVDTPYAQLPNISLNASPALPAPFRANISGELVAFRHPTKQNGDRMIFNPSLSMPLATSYGFITPKLGLHSTSYRLDASQGASSGHQSRTLPIFSVDGGLFFDRELNWFDTDLIQSLEPRLYYVRVPYRDQSKLPNFDAGEADFNFAQMFSENRFTGNDRINDANQLTVALTSRLFETYTGAERLRLAIGQRFYFQKQQVTLSSPARKENENSSDIIASIGGQPLPNWWVDSSWQYNQRDHRTQKTGLNLRYQPEPGHLLNVRYRYDRAPTPEVKQIDISGQWPIAKGWYGMARQNYSLEDRKALESLLGLEYNAGCWAFRMVGQRFVTSAQDAPTTLFFQLELNDVGRLGSNPLETLRQSIPGYSKLN
ncbi:LPS-assembly protein LptD [Parachitinimonas caeni]|uniref:LPS-assembly protein LptD n=1 Tax=Parachitinimonas caeni TaxID=3031301 RepID=A0ABT7DQY8_9NEIS|nr:LPS-assembly protein LptD [Parachitinimonas caeni]MDK2122488.1 LPS-assembly protein LptD [Parachitinimonas caeni]